MSNSILILGRGNSLSRIDEVTEQFDLYGLINNWNSMLDGEKFRNILYDKELIHFPCSGGQALLSKSNYEKYNIKYCQLGIFEKEYESFKNKITLNKWNIETKFLLEEMFKPSIDGGFPTTGVLAIVNSVVSLKIKNISVIGMDFYEDLYYTDDTYFGGRQAPDYLVDKGKRMMTYLTSFTKNNPNVNFTFYTNSKTFRPDTKNVKIIGETNE